MIERAEHETGRRKSSAGGSRAGAGGTVRTFKRTALRRRSRLGPGGTSSLGSGAAAAERHHRHPAGRRPKGAPLRTAVPGSHRSSKRATLGQRSLGRPGRGLAGGHLGPAIPSARRKSRAPLLVALQRQAQGWVLRRPHWDRGRGARPPTAITRAGTREWAPGRQARVRGTGHGIPGTFGPPTRVGVCAVTRPWG